MLGRIALFVPAISDRKMEKALSLDVDAIYFDLEDSIAPDQKDQARANLIKFLAGRDFGDKCILARINSVGSPYWFEDVAALAGARNLSGLVLPNAEAASVSLLSAQLDRFDSPLKIVPLIESARGLEESREAVLASKRVIGLQFGAEDYTVSLGVRRSLAGDEITYARARLANLGRAYNLEMMDTPFTAVDKPELLARDCQTALALGFSGKAVIHPSHIDIVKNGFRPGPEEIEKARRIIAAYENQTGEKAGVFTLDGAMIDAPIIQRARDTLNKAGQ